MLNVECIGVHVLCSGKTKFLASELPGYTHMHTHTHTEREREREKDNWQAKENGKWKTFQIDRRHAWWSLPLVGVGVSCEQPPWLQETKGWFFLSQVDFLQLIVFEKIKGNSWATKSLVLCKVSFTEFTWSDYLREHEVQLNEHSGGKWLEFLSKNKKKDQSVQHYVVPDVVLKAAVDLCRLPKVPICVVFFTLPSPNSRFTFNVRHQRSLDLLVTPSPSCDAVLQYYTDKNTSMKFEIWKSQATRNG